ncbi:MAG: valine--pyruvate transaminase [Sedimentisphaerales bacterium]|nr:valine--pyruvate transaminase [Sedimentisphaerales bacterium]
MEISRFGKKIAETSGIGQLMEDLGVAYSKGRNILMLGGGNPAHIPKVQEYFRISMEKLLHNSDDFERTIGNYDPPGGNQEFIKAISALLSSELGWNIGPENIALTNGSQTAFFILFNIFAGEFEGRASKRILFPLTPEYIGYCDVGLKDDLFVANKPQIAHIDDRIFKYHVDFDKINITNDIGAICVSRPTNPTGNVLTDAEVEKLSKLAQENKIPLIIDNAYGMPFPNIVFTEAKTVWNENTIFCMSLSKFGLPALRTGIVIANEEVITMVSRMNAVMSLAPGGMGAAIMMDLIRTGEIINLSRNVITPYYQQKAEGTLEQVYKELDGIDFHVHKPEGAFFLWLWFPNLPITTSELYERLKARGVLIVPGHYFFPGLKESWQHKNECIRVNYSQDEETVTAGIKIIADEVKRAYDAD